MNDIVRFGGGFAAPAYAAGVYLSSLALVFFAAVILTVLCIATAARAKAA